MKFLLKWWWPSYALVFPLIFSSSSQSSLESEFTTRFLLNLIAIIGGVLLEMASHPDAKLADIKSIPNWLKSNPVIYFAILYGFWVVTAGFFTQNPSVAISGSTKIYSPILISYGTSVWEFSFSLIFILIYIRSKNQENLKFLILNTILISCSLISFLAITEVITKSSLLTGANNSDGQLPYVNFMGRGHLAGFLCIGFGSMLYFLKSNLKYQLPMYLICLGIGVTQNRSSLIAVSVVLFLLLLQNMKARFFIFVASAIFVSMGFLLSQELLWKDKTIVFRTQGDLTSGRLLLWKSAFKGILASPVFGWGGIDYASHWGDFLTREELESYFAAADFGGEYKRHFNEMYVLKDKEGKIIFKSMNLWYAHNDFLDRSINYGLLGYVFYLFILIYSIKNGLKDWSVIGVIAYQVFLLTWFPAGASHGTYWSLMAIACASQQSLLGLKKQALP